MNKETLRMQMLAGIITESQYKAKLNEEIDIPSEIDQYFKSNPITKDNPYPGEFTAEINQILQDKLGRPLTPKEKSSVTRIYKKYLKKHWRDEYQEIENKEKEEEKDRYQKNLLPLTTSNFHGTPDSTYYEPAHTYHDTDRDGKTWVSHSDPKSGHTFYKLKNKWINTPVEDSLMNKFWKGIEPVD